MAFSTPLEICLVAGEASGDVHGAHLSYALKSLHSDIVLWGAAGPQMRAAGVDAVVGVEDLAVMGIIDVLGQLPQLSQVFKKLRRLIEQRQPQAVVFIDYPGFNLRLMQDIYDLGITTIYHIPPKIWAHGAKRAAILAEKSYLVTCILPFEEQLLRRKQINAHFIGNPLRDATAAFEPKNARNKNSIALLPGSRRREVEKVFPILIAAFVHLQKKLETQIVARVPIADTLDSNYVRTIGVSAVQSLGLTDTWFDKNVSLEKNANYEIMSTTNYAWVCSGTATLETAFFGTPLSLVYITDSITYFLAKTFLKIPYVGLVNLCENFEVIPEFIQDEATTENLVGHALDYWHEGAKRNEMISSLQKICLRFPINASLNCAEMILETALKFNQNVSIKKRLQKFGDFYETK